MKIPSLILAGLTLASHAALPSEADRQAIRAMAGTHHVTFRFEETTPVAPSYSLKEGYYEAEATELVEIVEDTSQRIALQHLLVVEKDGKPVVIKHWAQIWTWQDTEILDYCGSEDIHEWNKVTLNPEQAEGTWSQLVTQVDDTPRYESYGRWTHEAGESSWQSQPTRRPLPRREYSKRDDYDYLLVTNRHTIGNDGWVHFQDNRKVVDRMGSERQVLCFEFGLNRYSKSEDPNAGAAATWWKEHGRFWDEVREFWVESGEQAPKSFAYTTSKNGQSLSQLLKGMQEKPPAAEEIAAALQPFVVVK